MSSDITGTSIAIVNGTVVAIQGSPISSTPPTTDQVLEWNGTQWVPTTPPSTLPPSGSAGGDLDGSYPNPSVIGLQGQLVNSAAPTDGYVLTWDGTDGYWIARPNVGLRTDYFTSSGTWTCPDNVFNVILIGAGGGGGGSISGGAGDGGSGGGGSIQQTGQAAVIPGTNYTVNIGAGGAGGNGTPAYGGDGSPTSFGNIFYANGGGGGQWTNNVLWYGGANFPYVNASVRFNGYGPAYGGDGGGMTITGTGGPLGGNFNWSSSGGEYAGGIIGTASAYAMGGAGGGAGPQGNGASGGAGATTSNSFGSVGNDAADNTGAGGGGGGGGTGSDGHNTAGGAGGSGYLRILY